jgi:hypothetical protein
MQNISMVMNMNIIIEDIKGALKNSFDVVYREIDSINGKIYVIYIESLVDKKFISEYIMAPLIRNSSILQNSTQIKNKILVSCTAEDISTTTEAINHILGADTVVLFSFLNEAIYCETKGFNRRGIEIPITEAVIKGPRAGFNETIQDNLACIRRRIINPDLKIESFKIGGNSQTTVAMVYIKGIAPNNLVNFVREKINAVNKKKESSFIFSANSIEEELKEKNTFFDTIGYTEKPDIACSKIAEGRVGVVVDGDPFVITAPYFFIENFQTSDDYSLNKLMGNMGRLLRYLAFVISTFMPPIYLALITYHFRLVPTVYLFKLSTFRAGVPVPTSIELLYMTIFFQIIREAGIRLPQPIGPTLSIVGALILGEATVSSGLASQLTVVVVAISSITSYLLPKVYSGVFVWNLILIGFSSLLGLPGFFMGCIILVAHLADLKSCEYPHLYPLGTYRLLKYDDVVLRSMLNKVSNKIFVEENAK